MQSTRAQLQAPPVVLHATGAGLSPHVNPVNDSPHMSGVRVYVREHDIFSVLPLKQLGDDAGNDTRVFHGAAHGM